MAQRLDTRTYCQQNVDDTHPVIGGALHDCEATLNLPQYRVSLTDGERLVAFSIHLSLFQDMGEQNGFSECHPLLMKSETTIVIIIIMIIHEVHVYITGPFEK